MRSDPRGREKRVNADDINRRSDGESQPSRVQTAFKAGAMVWLIGSLITIAAIVVIIVAIAS